MPRIRTIKPEFWDSPSTAKASAVARLLFIAMWNWADDYGRGTLNLKELEGFAFPNDDVAELSSGKYRNFRDCVAEVAACFDVAFYEVTGRPYYAILKWELHQRNERRAKSKFPAPEDGKTLEIKRDAASITEVPLQCGGTSVQTVGSSGIGTGEQGNRGTGEDLVPLRSDASPARANSNATSRIVNAWLDGIPASKRPPARTVNDATNQIAAMVREGIEPIDIANGLAEWWAGKYPPSTLPNYVARAQQGPKLATGTSRAKDTLELARQLEMEENGEPF